MADISVSGRQLDHDDSRLSGTDLFPVVVPGLVSNDKAAAHTYDELAARFAATFRARLRTAASDDWANGNRVLAVTVPDIDRYAYITVTLNLGGGAQSSTPRRVLTATIATADIKVDSTPNPSDAGLVLVDAVLPPTTDPVGTLTIAAIGIGRSTSGTTLYFRPNVALYGRVSAIWGGTF